jgi:hypothetical protein
MDGVGKYKDFRDRPKREDRKAMGREYSDFLLGCLRSEAGKEVLDDIIFFENNPVDLVWSDLSLGIECKRLVKTTFRNDGHAMAWLRREVISRFIEHARETGKPLNTRILCVSEKKWSLEVNNWFMSKGYCLIETGQIDSIVERMIAEGIFIDKFAEILSRVCKNGNSDLEVV